MSKFLVCQAHIDVLVSTCAYYRPSVPRDGQTGREVLAEIGRVLWQANRHALDALDPSSTHSRRPLPDYVPPAAAGEPLEPMAVLRAIDCYVHQSCSVHRGCSVPCGSADAGWSGSSAAEITDRLREAILAAHPELADYRAHWMYTRLPWHFTNLDYAHPHRDRSATPPHLEPRVAR